MAMRSLNPTNPLLSATVTADAESTPLALGYMFSAQAAFLIAVGAGLTATFKVMVSMDGVTYYDSGQVLPSVSGSASTFIAQYSGAFPFVLIKVVFGSGSGTVTITGSAKGGA